MEITDGTTIETGSTGHAETTVLPDPVVLVKAGRRYVTTEYKLGVPEEADRCQPHFGLERRRVGLALRCAHRSLPL